MVESFPAIRNLAKLFGFSATKAGITFMSKKFAKYKKEKEALLIAYFLQFSYSQMQLVQAIIFKKFTKRKQR